MIFFFQKKELRFKQKDLSDNRSNSKL